MQQEKEAEAACAEANVLEEAVDSAAMGELVGVHNMDQVSLYHSAKRTEKYVQEQYAYVKAEEPTEDPEQDKKAGLTPSAAVHLKPADDSHQHKGPPSSRERRPLSAKDTAITATAANTMRQPLQFTPKRGGVFNAPQPTFETRRPWAPRHDTWHYNYPHVGGASSNTSVLGRFLARRELLTAGLTQFIDKPENYWVWRFAFSNATEDLGLKPSEELDLLTKWLGPESAEHARKVRSVRINHPGEALSMVWRRLEEVYGSPAAMETALFSKLERFPKFPNKEPKRFNIADNTSPYTLKTCAGVSEAAGRRARGFVVQSADEKSSLALPTLVECDHLPDNRAEIPTPAAAKCHPHLKSLASKIPPLDSKHRPRSYFF